MKKQGFIALAMSAISVLSAHAGLPFGPGMIFAGHPGNIGVYNSSGTLLETIPTGLGGEQTGMAFDSAGFLYATAFQADRIQKISPVDSSITTPNPFAIDDSGSHNESIVFNKAGHLLIGQADGTRDVIERDATGAFVTRYNVGTAPRGSDWIDLAADQHTLFSTSEGHTVYRFDLATSTQLPNLTTTLPGPTAYALRILPDNSILVADSDRVVRLDTSGSVIQTYGLGSDSTLFALNLDPDGQHFWTAGISSGKIFEYDIATGALVTSFNTGSEVAGLAVFGEITEGGPSPDTGVPDAGATLSLFSIGLLTLAGATRVIRRK